MSEGTHLPSQNILVLVSNMYDEEAGANEAAAQAERLLQPYFAHADVKHITPDYGISQALSIPTMAADPPLQIGIFVALDILLNVGYGLVSNALYDAIKALMRGRQTTVPNEVFIIDDIEQTGGHINVRKRYARVATNDPQVLRTALESLPDAFQRNYREPSDFDADRLRWVSSRTGAPRPRAKRARTPERKPPKSNMHSKGKSRR
jgi:hypothetical protein